MQNPHDYDPEKIEREYGYWADEMKRQFQRIFDERDYNSEETLESALGYFKGVAHFQQKQKEQQEKYRLLMSVCVNWGQKGIPLEEAETIRKKREEETLRLNIFNDMMDEGIKSYHLGK